MLIYLDTNVYSRPFDDQTILEIQEETDAFLKIINQVKTNRFSLLCSDILEFEVHNIFDIDKSMHILDYLNLCTQHISSSNEILNLGTSIQYQCHVKARDALHIASAILGGARYFLSCDKYVTKVRQRKCYRRIAKLHRQEYFSVMNPILFINKMNMESSNE